MDGERLHPYSHAMVVLVERLWLDGGALLVACFCAGCLTSPSVTASTRLPVSFSPLEGICSRLRMHWKSRTCSWFL